MRSRSSASRRSEPSSTSRSTAIRRPARSRSRSPTRRRTAGSSRASWCCLTGMGAGLTWGSALIRLDTRDDWSAGMTKIAFMFPGQGSFAAGMGKDVAEAVPEAMAVYDEGSEASGLDLKELCFHGPVEELVDTEVQQPALVATSLALDAALRARGIRPDYVVGHSVGEFAALGSAQSLSAREAIGLVRERGLAMAATAQGAPRLDGGHPRPRRRGGRGALQEDLERVAGELQLPGPARHLRRDALGRRGVRRGGARGRAPCDQAARLRRVPLAARRARGRPAAPRDREGAPAPRAAPRSCRP